MSNELKTDLIEILKEFRGRDLTPEEIEQEFAMLGIKEIKNPQDSKSEPSKSPKAREG